jgi:hypothetical protein
MRIPAVAAGEVSRTGGSFVFARGAYWLGEGWLERRDEDDGEREEVAEFHSGIVARGRGERAVTFCEEPWYWNWSGFLFGGGRSVA